MKKILYSMIIIVPFLLADTQNTTTSPTSQSQTDNITNNITGGLFIGLGLSANALFGTPTFSNDNLFTYSVDDKKPENRNSLNLYGGGIEGKLGFMKTFKNIGIRIYGYYGKTWGSYDTLGTPKRIPGFVTGGTDNLIQTGYIDMEYYGGIADFMLGSFQTPGAITYITIGGGYQFTSYKFAGNISIGDSNTNNIDIYSGTNKKIINNYPSPVVSIGVGTYFGKRSIIEANFRGIINTPVVNSSTPIAYETSAYSVRETTSKDLIAPRYSDGDTIKIKNDFLQINMTLSYIFLF